jgi:hypothetical protein
LLKAEVHSLLGKAQLKGGRIAAAIESFIKANDTTFYRELTNAATEQGMLRKYDRFASSADLNRGCFVPLALGLYLPVIKYLRMCRPVVIFCFWFVLCEFF